LLLIVFNFSQAGSRDLELIFKSLFFKSFNLFFSSTLVQQTMIYHLFKGHKGFLSFISSGLFLNISECIKINQKYQTKFRGWYDIE